MTCGGIFVDCSSRIVADVARLQGSTEDDFVISATIGGRIAFGVPVLGQIHWLLRDL